MAGKYIITIKADTWTLVFKNSVSCFDIPVILIFP